MTSITTARPARTGALTKLVVAAGAIAISAIGLSPAAQAETIEHSCTTNPGAYAAGGVRGVYSTKRVGNDREEICSVYDAHGKLLTQYTKPDYGFYDRRANVPSGATSLQ